MSLLSTLIIVFIVSIYVSLGSYKLDTEYKGDTFFDDWWFFTDPDPTHGYVDYVDRETAESKGYINPSTSSVYIGADHSNVVGASERGRDSIRISSNKKWNYGLFIIELTHIPTGCGTWPAFWLLGDCHWPYCGEIDIIEGVHTDTTVSTVLHTDDECTTIDGRTCKDFNGCPIHKDNAFGPALNGAGGAVFALEWNADGIFSWHWPINEAPSNVKSYNPDTTRWGAPYASWPFGSHCPSSKFKNMYLIFDLTFCGDWAGNTWHNGCSAQTNNNDCTNYVRYNPNAFDNAYWLIHYVRVFQNDGSGVQPNIYSNIQSFGGKCLNFDVNNLVQIYDCNQQSEQKWKYDSSTKAIINKGGKCLDVHFDDFEDNINSALVQIWDCNQWPNQKWTIINNQIISANGKCLDIDLPQLHTNGGRVQLWDCAQSQNQLWNIQSI